MLALLQDVAGGEPVAPAVLDLWRVCDGQRAPVQPTLAQQLNMPALAHHDGGAWCRGLLGGYTAYQYEVCNVLLPLEAAMNLTKFVRSKLVFLQTEHSTKVVFACSWQLSMFFLVDVRDGGVYAYTQQNTLLPACPSTGAGRGEGLLRWVEEYARRLECGIYTMEPLRPEDGLETAGISIFPRSGPDVVRGVTNHVEVTGSWVYMPMHQQGWGYSISLRLLGTPQERNFKTCQLVERHWEISEDGQDPNHVRGEGVIGLFPILNDNGWLLNNESDPNGQYGVRGEKQMPAPFRYQSCAGRTRSMTQNFGGEITFVPGTRSRPTGEQFTVRMPAFRLCVPEFLY